MFGGGCNIRASEKELQQHGQGGSQRQQDASRLQVWLCYTAVCRPGVTGRMAPVASENWSFSTLHMADGPRASWLCPAVSMSCSSVLCCGRSLSTVSLHSGTWQSTSDTCTRLNSPAACCLHRGKASQQRVSLMSLLPAESFLCGDCKEHPKASPWGANTRRLAHWRVWWAAALTPAIREHPHLHLHPGQWCIGSCPWGCLRCFQQLALSAPSLPTRYPWHRRSWGLPPLPVSVRAGGSVSRGAEGSRCPGLLLAVLPPCHCHPCSTPECPAPP